MRSSANNLTVVFPLHIDVTSFTNIRNKTGPKTEPCAPLITSLTEEKQFSKTTHCDRPCIKLDNHASKLPDIHSFLVYLLT